MTPPFACISTAVLDPKVIAVIGTSPLTLLVYLHTLVDYRTGQRTRPYDHQRAAADLGVSLRTIKGYFKALADAGLITVSRHAHGVDFAVVRTEQSEVQIPALHHGHEVQAFAPHEGQKSALQPSRGKNPDSESPTQSPPRGGRAMVGGPPPTAQPAPLTPPDQRIVDFFQDTLDEVGRILPAPLELELQRTTAGVLREHRRHPIPALRAALLDAARDVARGKWHLTPGLWRDRVRKAIAADAAGPAAGGRFPSEVSGATNLRGVFAAEREVARGVGG